MTDCSEELVVYRCTECGKTSVSIGWLHAHINNRCTGFGPFNVLPSLSMLLNPFQAAQEKTDVLRVEEYSVVGVDEVTVDE